MPSERQTRAGRIGQGAFLGVIAAYILLLAFELPELSRGARLFPAIILVASALFAALKLLSTFNARAARLLEPDVGSLVAGAGAPVAGAAREPEAQPVAPSTARSAVVAWLWVAGTVAAMYVIGFLAGIAIAVLVYMRFPGGEGWRVSLAAAAITTLFAYLVFVRAMHIPIEFGLMSGLVPIK